VFRSEFLPKTGSPATGYAVEEDGYLIPFGDSPNPIYRREMGKRMIQNMRNQANRYVYMM